MNRIEPIIDLLSLKGEQVLDLGCNEGFFSVKLAEKGAKVLGADIDKLRIKKAKWIQSILGFENPTFRVLDIYSEEFKSINQKFDFAYAWASFIEYQTLIQQLKLFLLKQIRFFSNGRP